MAIATEMLRLNACVQVIDEDLERRQRLLSSGDELLLRNRNGKHVCVLVSPFVECGVEGKQRFYHCEAFRMTM